MDAKYATKLTTLPGRRGKVAASASTATAPPQTASTPDALISDVSADGSLIIGGARLYHLVHLDSAAAANVTITFNAPNARAYAFTFGG